MSNLSDDTKGVLFGAIVVLPSFVSFGIGAVVLAYQATHWLQHAVWPRLTVRDGLAWWSGGTFSEGSTGALGLNQFAGWCLNGSLPLWTMLIFPLAWIFLGIFVFTKLFPEIRRKIS